jgi:hypothetical protein
MRKNVCEWQVIRLRAKGEYLGKVQARPVELTFCAAHDAPHAAVAARHVNGRR